MSEKNNIDTQVVQPLMANGTAKKDGDSATQPMDDSYDTKCGIGSFRPQWLQRFASIRIMFALLALTVLSFSFAMSVSIVGISNLQKRYGLSSSFMGLYHTIKDVAEIFSIIVVTYFGGRPGCHKPRWIAGGLLICSLGFFTKSMTQFLSDPYDYASLEVNNNTHSLEVCGADRDLDHTKKYQDGDTVSCEVNFLSSVIPKGSEVVVLMLLGNIILGLGNTPMFTLAIAYIDDNVPKEKSPMYTGTFFALFGIGPIIGMPMASYFTNLYVDFYRVDSEDVDINPGDPRWVGAWWLGYLILSIPVMLLALMVGLVPKEMPNKTGSSDGDSLSKEKLEAERQITMETSQTAEKRWQDFPKALKRICTNLTLMAVIFARAAMMANQGVIVFIVKFTEEQFRVTTAISGVVVASMIFSACTGFFIGGVVLRRWKPTLVKMAAFMVILDLMSVCAPIAQMKLGCDTAEFAGVNTPYVGSTIEAPALQIKDLNATCNAHCECSEYYNPVCGSDHVNYYSPCHAGCKIAKDSKNFTSCGCVLRYEEMDEGIHAIEGEVYAEICGNTCFDELLWYASVTFIFSGLAAMSMMAELTLTLRCVAPADKPFALGVRSFVAQLFGTLPSPLYTGAAIDSACILWGKTKCGDRGACLIYDLPDYRFKFMGLMVLFRSITIVLYVVALLSLYRNPDPGKNQQSSEEKSKEETLIRDDDGHYMVQQMVTSL